MMLLNLKKNLFSNFELLNSTKSKLYCEHLLYIVQIKSFQRQKMFSLIIQYKTFIVL